MGLELSFGHTEQRYIGYTEQWYVGCNDSRGFDLRYRAIRERLVSQVLADRAFIVQQTFEIWNPELNLIERKIPELLSHVRKRSLLSRYGQSHCKTIKENCIVIPTAC